jgi:hypothetical protein
MIKMSDLTLTVAEKPGWRITTKKLGPHDTNDSGKKGVWCLTKKDNQTIWKGSHGHVS